MSERTGRLVYAVSVGLFGVALAAGLVQSLRDNGRPPGIDLPMNVVTGGYVQQLITNKHYDQAIDELRTQVRMFPHDADSIELLGKLLGETGQHEKAQIAFQELVRLRPKDANARCLLGRAYLNLQEPDQASECFSQALSIDAEFPPAFNGLGLAHVQRGQFAEAEKYFARAVELAPTYAEARAHLTLARQALSESARQTKKE